MCFLNKPLVWYMHEIVQSIVQVVHVVFDTPCFMQAYGLSPVLQPEIPCPRISSSSAPSAMAQFAQLRCNLSAAFPTGTLTWSYFKDSISRHKIRLQGDSVADTLIHKEILRITPAKSCLSQGQSL